MQKSTLASHPRAAESKQHMIRALTKYHKVPGQAKNVESMLNAVKNGHIPNGHKPILYAIGGKAGLATVAEFGEDLKNKLKQDPNVKYHYYCWNSQLIANTTPALPAAANTQTQLAQYAYFGKSPMVPYAHEIMVEFRCPASLGGNENVIRRAATVNDTGSNAQNIHRSDWDALRAPGLFPMPGSIHSATGPGNVENVVLDVRIVKPEVRQNPGGQQVTHYLPLTKWYTELLILVDDGKTLLSGAAMRDCLYFATAPGNDRLLVSQRKQAIIHHLEVIQPGLP